MGGVTSRRSYSFTNRFCIHPRACPWSSAKADKYAFGCKVSVAATSRGGWFVGAKAFHGNPDDGHTLKESLQQVERISRAPEHVFVGMGSRVLMVTISTRY
jgi:hypothetical protein